MATASQSLFKMAVNLPTGDSESTTQGLLMPKLQYRFRVLFQNFGLGDGLALTKQVVDVTRPNLTFDEITLNVYNSRIYMAGKHTWSEITVNVRDDASGTVSKATGQQLQKQLDFVEQASAASGQDYKFMTMIEVLDGGNGGVDPVVLEAWELYGCFLKGANYGSLNYGTSDVATIALQIRYDNAVQTPLASGIGATIARTLGSSTTGIGSVNSGG